MKLPAFSPREIGDLVISRDQSYSSKILRVKVSRIPLLLLDLSACDVFAKRAHGHFFCGKRALFFGKPENSLQAGWRLLISSK